MALATTVTNTLDQSRMFLNDVGSTLYTDAVLLPVFRTAYQEMEDLFVLHGIPRLAVVDAVQTITAVSGVLYPNPIDMLFPIDMFERAVGDDNDHWVPVTEVRFLPNKTQDTILGFWQFANQLINLIGATANRQAKLRYKKTLTVLSAGSTIEVFDSKSFLAARTGELAARFIGKDRERADYCQQIAETAKDTLLSTHVNQMQSLPVRQRRFNWKTRTRRGPIPQ